MKVYAFTVTASLDIALRRSRMTRKRSWTCRCQRMAEVFCIFLYVCACEDVAVLPNLAGASFSAVVVVEACFGAYNCCRCGCILFACCVQGAPMAAGLELFGFVLLQLPRLLGSEISGANRVSRRCAESISGTLDNADELLTNVCTQQSLLHTFVRRIQIGMQEYVH